MTRSDGDNILSDSKHGNREYRRRKIRGFYMINICKYRDNEYDRVSAIYIHTDSAHCNRARNECKYIDRSYITRDRKLWK